MKGTLVLVGALLVVALIWGCTPKGADQTNQGSKRSETTYLKFPTAGTSGAVYTIAAAIANEWTTKIPGLQISAEASNGGVQNLNLIAQKDAQVGVAVTSIVTQQKQGAGQFEGHIYDGMRILSALYVNYNQIAVSSNSGINTFRDLKGKNFAPGAPGSTTTAETQVAFEAAGMNYPDDIRAQFIAADQAIELMQNRQLDGVWVQSGIPTSSISQIIQTANGKLLSIDEDIIRAICDEYSWYSRVVIPASTYGLSADVVTTGLPITIVIDESVPEDLVYQMAKVMWENVETIRNTHSAMKGATLEGAVQNLGGLPLHPGAERYYREKGVLK
jgi:TRAP transporter TAXI family solute receptor